MSEKQKLLKELPSVDEILKGDAGVRWCRAYPRRYVLQAIRDVIDMRRKEIMDASSTDVSVEGMTGEIEMKIEKLSAFSLQPVINATGIVIHTNLGRSILSEKILDNVKKIAESYSNLEYNLEEGRRGKRYAHITGILREITGAEDALIVNNNAAAVLLCLSALAKGREVIVSRGELVEIGGSFRVPDIMSLSGAVLREVGTTNKTHLYDYKNAINENTALILKVHKSNYRISGFTEEAPAADLKKLSEEYHIPVMYDIGSGCMIDLKPYGIHSEPSVREIIKSGVDVVTFSGDKLLGGPQGGVIVGRKEYIEKLQKNPLTRALRIDKLTLAAFEAALMEYLDEDKAVENIPTLKMLLQKPERIKERAKQIALRLKRKCASGGKAAKIEVTEDTSKAGGGSLPEIEFPTYAVLISPENISVNDLEERLRKGTPAIIARIKDHALLLDARTIRADEIDSLVQGVNAALY
ncbi:MAG: L-seryl-tRNA(Sec) selenium transferase [Nitrospirae bacterium CG02_land_8_20_14_3_00_44_33]|nr:L-seryl-tRNA(Sec) selenium transferase [Nitrospirota bacterium]OIO29995.1 MAG: L-seryl-tRNA(Sec) selenium transferase [Nitrospirae bacterium CG1_02_44_142]PIV43236.1 MAG: L-seryl-tRNA(Sec) selenium transferase [Nitrospirae bacterium CG02_land_8_20_14_3_00_44_33]PIV65597.1 MAG: L-seryl-tRNA(Sec) selenium transferase [Nitrospirae bacterium CG01_land_8_20_14_3_00_44_22]PIW90686.1 MAG: L-seryl-tRNA(Sec) selenium transferase [Nitrospirae bacterium CG_4_8_14_3_um_filter_44_28]PJA82853.1 MAG: L-se